jgi:hypothetical protein
METTPNTSPSVRRHLVRLGISLATVITAGFGVVTAASGAMFTDTETATMDVSSGWVDITVGGTNVVALSNLKPGDVFFRSLNLANAGSLDFNYGITANRPTGAGAPLVDAILVETWKLTDGANCTAANYQTGTLIAASSTLTALNVVNQVMTPASSHAVCFRLSLPMSTPNAIAGKTSNVTMTIASQQN